MIICIFINFIFLLFIFTVSFHFFFFFFFSSRRRHTRWTGDWSSDVCSSDLLRPVEQMRRRAATISAAEDDARLPLPEAQDEVRRLGETLNEMLARLQREIGRASCRERVEISVGAVALKKKNDK